MCEQKVRATSLFSGICLALSYGQRQGVQKKKNPQRLWDAAAGSSFWDGFWSFGPSWPSCWGRGELGLCSPSVPCSSHFMAVPTHLRARVHTRVHAQVGMHTGVPCSCVCTEGAGMHGGGLQARPPPRPEPRGRKPAILCGRSPCRYNAREGIMPGLTF